MDTDNLARIGAPQRPRIRPEILAKMADVPLRRVEPVRPGAGVQQPPIDDGSAIERSRVGLAKIDFLPPEAIPSALALARGLPAETRRLCREAFALSPSEISAALAALARQSRGMLPKSRRSIAALIAADAPSDCDVHDEFFNIRRATKAGPFLYVQSVLEVLVAFHLDLAEAPTALDGTALSRIEAGLLTVVSRALGDGSRGARGLFPTTSVPRFEDHAARRWIRGHQIFAALSQGLIFAMDRLGAAVEGGAPPDDAVGDIVIGFEACAAALEFTGDFGERVYDEHIRPSMCPPHLPRGFSGLLSADHAHLVRRMKEVKPSLETLQARYPECHRAMAVALANVYDSHKRVCAKFVGADRSSLLMASGSGRSSVEQLERFKAMRIRNLG